ncbi:hypothetical protein MKS82_19560 [Ochrobactrum sp. A-1]|nr:hypothetical protein [Ochrobactrum sp. A-1]
MAPSTDIKTRKNREEVFWTVCSFSGEGIILSFNHGSQQSLMQKVAFYNKNSMPRKGWTTKERDHRTCQSQAGFYILAQRESYHF